MKLGDIDERKLTGGEKRSKEAHFKKLKKHKKDFTDRYGDEGESIMHAIATKRAKGESVGEGWEELPPINREKYGNREREGLEGPIQTRSGKTIYYDTKQGMYYDPDTDMYISYDDFKMLDKKGMHMVGKMTNRHDNIPEAVGDAAEAFYQLQDEFAGEEARGAHKVLIDELVRYLSVDQLEDFVADFRRHYDMNEGSKNKKQSVTEGVLDDTDEDGWMAKSQLYKLAKYSIGLHGMISDTDNLEPWIQAKITRASEDMSSVKHYLEYQAVNPHGAPEPVQGPMEEDMDDVSEHKSLATHLTQMAAQDDADDGMDGDYFRDVARAVMGHDVMEIRAAILDGDTEPRERVLDHIAQNHPDLLKEIFPRDARNPGGYLATMREADENHYLCVHASKGTMKCTAGTSYEAAKKAAAHWKMKSTAGIDAHLMSDEPKTATEGNSPHKKGSDKYKKHMAAKHAGMNEGSAEQLEKQAIDFFTSIKSKINTSGKR